MATPRSQLVDSANSSIYHCISRCVRRAFLCGDREAASHRKQWIKDDLVRLSAIFAIDVLSFALMDSHMHLVIRTHPERANAWSEREVARRWAMLHPASMLLWAELLVGPADCSAMTIEDAIQILATDESRIEHLRRQLSSLSKLHQLLKQVVAHRANREDRCRGHFWEARFISRRVLDERALLATMIYVDLNPIRAAAAPTPEDSAYTSVQDRILVRQWARVVRGGEGANEVHRILREREARIWLAPIDATQHDDGITALTLDEYLELVDAMGRTVRPDKAGAIDAAAMPILTRLDQRGGGITTMVRRMFDGFIGSVIGTDASCAAEARRRGVQRVLGLRPADDP